MNRPGTEDLDLIRRDAALPGLGLVLDPARLLQRIADHPMIASATDFAIDYVRYKAGMNCLGRYRFTIDGTPCWAYAKAFSTESRAKLDKVRQLSMAGSPGETTLVLPEAGVFVSFFPHDLKLRTVSRLADPALCERLFRRIFDDEERWVGSAWQVLNYKPERRLVLRLAAADGASATLKFHTLREFSRLARVRRTFHGAPEVTTPRHIGQSRKHCCHAFEWIEGDTLRARLAIPELAVRDHREAGRLIARFHAMATSRGPEPASSAQEPALQSLAQQLAFLIPDLGDEALRLAAALRELDRGTPESQRLIHGDFYDKQVIVAGAEYGLIDLDCARAGDIHHDLGCFVAHRERRMLNDGTAGAAEHIRAFLDGYIEAGGDFSEQELRRWVAWHLLRLSHHPFRDRAPDWPTQTRAMIARAAEVLRAESAPPQIATA